MDASSLVLLVALVGLVILCFLSHTCAGRTRLGAQATATVERAIERLKKEALVLRSTSQQDDLLILALAHNSEALAAVRMARALIQEHGLISEELLDLSAQLQEEQDDILSVFAQEMDDEMSSPPPPPPPPSIRSQRFKPA